MKPHSEGGVVEDLLLSMSLQSASVAHISPHKTEVIIPVKDVIKEGVVSFEAKGRRVIICGEISNVGYLDGFCTDSVFINIQVYLLEDIVDSKRLRTHPTEIGFMREEIRQSHVTIQLLQRDIRRCRKARKQYVYIVVCLGALRYFT